MRSKSHDAPHYAISFPVSCSFLPFWGLHIFLSILVSSILSLCSRLNVRDQVSHPYKTKDRLMVPQLFISLITIMHPTDSLLHLQRSTIWTLFIVILNITPCSVTLNLKNTSYPMSVFHMASHSRRQDSSCTWYSTNTSFGSRKHVECTLKF